MASIMNKSISLRTGEKGVSLPDLGQEILCTVANNSTIYVYIVGSQQTVDLIALLFTIYRTVCCSDMIKTGRRIHENYFISARMTPNLSVRGRFDLYSLFSAKLLISRYVILCVQASELVMGMVRIPSQAVKKGLEFTILNSKPQSIFFSEVIFAFCNQLG